MVMVYQRCQSSRDSGIASGGTALVSLKLMGGNRVQDLMLRWNQALQAAGKISAEVGLQDILYVRMRESKIRRRDIEHYERASVIFLPLDFDADDLHSEGRNRHDLNCVQIGTLAGPVTPADVHVVKEVQKGKRV